MSSERSVKDVSGPDPRENGGAEGIRTLDLLDAIEARSQLRHGPTVRSFDCTTLAAGFAKCVRHWQPAALASTKQARS